MNGGRTLKANESNPLRPHHDKGWMAGNELVKDLAEIEATLSKELDEARQSAARRTAEAEQEARRILADADDEIRQMADALRTRIAEEEQKFSEEARLKAEAETQRIHRQAEQNFDRAVAFILSEVLP